MAPPTGFSAEVLEATADAAEHLEGMEEGWHQSFETLATHLEGEDR